MAFAKPNFANRSAYALYLVAIMWAPIPLGSNRVWAWSLLELAVFLCVLIITLFTALHGKQLVRLNGIQRHKVVVALFGLHLVYLLFQCLPFPSELMEWMNPLKAGWYYTELNILESEFVALSASPHHSLVEFYKQLAYVLIFCLTLCLLDSRKRLLLTLSAIVFVALIESVYGISATLMGADFTFWKPTDGNFAGGTFVNKNHFAANLSIGVGLSIGIGLYFLRKTKLPETYSKLSWFFLRVTKYVASPIGIVFLTLIILMIGMLLSQSRGALIALCLSAMLLLAIGAKVRGVRSPEGLVLFSSTLGIVAAYFFLDVGVNFAGLISLTIEDSPRWIHWKQTWSMFLDHPIAGVGNGAYQYVFTQYKQGDYAFYLIDYAHNDHLQLLAEQGVLGALIWYGAISVSFTRMFSAYTDERGSRRYQGMLIGCMIAVLGFIIHGLVDFNFHIPANALWFYTVLAIALVLVDRAERSSKRAG